MDGRGRCQDNIIIERLWWTIKYHNGLALRRGLSEWISGYNHDRGHSALDDRTPDEVYYDLPYPFTIYHIRSLRLPDACFTFLTSGK
jgi:putative transposase